MREALINGARLAWAERGRGPAVLLVHGFPMTHALWDAQLKALAPRSRVIAPDLRGFGQSEAPAGPVSMDLLADDLAALLDHLGIEQAVVGGLSMGGYVALAFWQRHGHRLRSLILADTRARADTAEERQAREANARLAERLGVAAVVDQMLPRLLAPGAAEQRPELAARARAIMLQVSPAGMAAALRGMAQRPDYTSQLPLIHCPTLVLVGEQDVVTPPAEARALVERLPRGRLVIIPGAGHLAPLEQPALVNQALLEFLAQR